MSDQNIEMVQRYWAAINARDVEGYLATFADDAVAHDPVGGAPLCSPEERRKFIQNLFGKFAQLRFTLDFLTAAGDSTAAKWTLSACTAEAALVQMEGIDTYRHGADGRIERLWAYPAPPVTTPPPAAT
jgi:steroid delta-isomerase